MRQVVLSTSYRAEVFADHFGTGADLGLELVRPEQTPLAPVAGSATCSTGSARTTC